jgi:hypothetical protein
LEPDVERALKTAVRERGVSFKQTLDEAVRAGLARPGRRPNPPFVQKTYAPGAEQNFRWDKTLAASGSLDLGVGRQVARQSVAITGISGCLDPADQSLFGGIQLATLAILLSRSPQGDAHPPLQAGIDAPAGHGTASTQVVPE